MIEVNFVSRTSEGTLRMNAIYPYRVQCDALRLVIVSVWLCFLTLAVSLAARKGGGVPSAAATSVSYLAQRKPTVGSVPSFGKTSVYGVFVPPSPKVVPVRKMCVPA